MSNFSTDQNLLFGVISLQMDVVNAEQFVTACSSWASDKGKPLSDHMITLGFMDDEARDDIMRMIKRRMAKHDDDVRASLMASITPDILPVIDQVQDEEIQQSLAGEVATIDPSAIDAGGNIELMHTIDHDATTRDRYTLSRLQGRGGVGQVWVARDQDLGRDVALKELRTETGDRESIKKRFLQEARITGQLEHPGIVPVYELSETDNEGRPFYTMRFVRGQTLRDAIRAYHKKLAAGEAEALELVQLLGNFIDICHALSYAHSRDVLHRDLKSENVIIGSYGETVVLDWGLAKLIGEDEDESIDQLPRIHVSGDDVSRTLDGQVLGTPAYMPPEQAEGRLDEIDVRSDVYGLGAILYEILAGKAPFTGDQTQDVLKAVIHLMPESPHKINANTDKAIEAICLKALSKRRADRYQTATQLGEDVQRFLADEPVSCFVEPLGKRLGRWARKHRTAVVGTSVLAVAAIVALAVSTVLINEQKREAISARNDATVAKLDAEKQRDLATTARAVSEKLRGIAEEQRDAAEKARSETELAKQESDRLRGVAETERDAADKARGEAEIAKADAETQRQLAQDNFQQAKNAVDEYLLNISNSDELASPELRDLRNELLASARDYYEDFIEQGLDDPEIVVDLAKAHVSLGRIEQTTGNVEIAAEHYTKSVDLLTTGVFDKADVAAQSVLMTSLRLRSIANQVSQQTTKALADAIAALEIAELLVRVSENLSVEEQDAAKQLLREAQENHQVARAVSGFNPDEVINIQEALVTDLRERYKEDPDNTKLAIEFVSSLLSLADQVRSTSGIPAAEATFEEADQITRKLMAENPDEPDVIEARVEWLADYFLSTIDGVEATAASTANIQECLKLNEVLLKHDPNRQRFVYWSYFFRLRKIQIDQNTPGISVQARAMMDELLEIPKGTYTYFHTRSSILNMLTVQAMEALGQGDNNKAVLLLREASDRGLQMLREYPDDLGMLAGCVNSAKNFALANGLGNPESLSVVKQVIDELEVYLDRGVDSANIYVKMIPLYAVVNHIGLQTNNPLLGKPISKRALEIALRLHKRWPENEALIVGTEPLISSYFGTLRLSQQNQEAETFAREILVPFVTSTAGKWKNNVTLGIQAACYMNAYLALLQMGYEEEAIVFFLEATELYEECLRVDPENELFKEPFQKAMGSAAIMLSQKLWYDLAAKYSDKMIELIEHPQLKPVLGILLTQAMSRLHRPSDTYDLILRFRRENLYQDANSKVAYVQALAEIVRDLEMDESLTVEQREVLANTYRQLAIEIVNELKSDNTIQDKQLITQIANHMTVFPFYRHADFLETVADIYPEKREVSKMQFQVRELIRADKDDEAQALLDAWETPSKLDAVIKADLTNILRAKTADYDQAFTNLGPPYSQEQRLARSPISALYASQMLETTRYVIESATLDETITEQQRSARLEEYETALTVMIKRLASRDGRLAPIGTHNYIWLPEMRWARQRPIFQEFSAENYKTFLALCRSPSDYLTKEAVLRNSLLRDVVRAFETPEPDTFYKYLAQVSQALLDDLAFVKSDDVTGGVTGQLTESLEATQSMGAVPVPDDMWLTARKKYLETLQENERRLTEELDRVSKAAPELFKSIDDKTETLRQLLKTATK